MPSETWFMRIQRWYYELGHRPKSWSLLFSPTLAIEYGYRDARVKEQSEYWRRQFHESNIILKGMRDSALTAKCVTNINWFNSDYGALQIHMNFCPMCGMVLQQRKHHTANTKECPEGHGRIYATDSPDGSQAIIVFEPYGMD